MRFKDLPGWLRGGTIGGGIALSIYLVKNIVLWAIPDLWILEIIFLYISLFPLITLSVLIGSSDFLEPIISNTSGEGFSYVNNFGVIIFILIWFIVGGFIGWITSNKTKN